MLFSIFYVFSPISCLRLLGQGILVSFGARTLDCVAATSMPEHARTARTTRMVRVSSFSAW
jgi:hypothetical protein